MTDVARNAKAIVDKKNFHSEQPFGASHVVASCPERLTTNEIRESPILVRVTTEIYVIHPNLQHVVLIPGVMSIVSQAVLSYNCSINFIIGDDSLPHIFVVYAQSLVKNNAVQLTNEFNFP